MLRIEWLRLYCPVTFSQWVRNRLMTKMFPIYVCGNGDLEFWGSKCLIAKFFMTTDFDPTGIMRKLHQLCYYRKTTAKCKLWFSFCHFLPKRGSNRSVMLRSDCFSTQLAWNSFHFGKHLLNVFILMHSIGNLVALVLCASLVALRFFGTYFDRLCRRWDS